MPIGLALFVIPLPLELSLHVSVALASIVVIPSIVAFRQSRERTGLEKALPDFIRDVAEGRKIGLSPEGSIEQLGSKNYGRLSKSIKTMGSQISWGLPIVKVIKTFAESVDSWITMAIGTLMVEVVDVGGGTVNSFLADGRLHQEGERNRGRQEGGAAVLHLRGLHGGDTPSDDDVHDGLLPLHAHKVRWRDGRNRVQSDYDYPRHRPVAA